MKKMIVMLIGLMFLFSVSMVCGQTKAVDPVKPVVSAPAVKDVPVAKVDTKAEAKKVKNAEKAAKAKAKADAKAKAKADAKAKKAADKAAAEKAKADIKAKKAGEVKK